MSFSAVVRCVCYHETDEGALRYTRKKLLHDLDAKPLASGGNFGAKARLDFDGVAWYPNPLCGDSCMLEPTWNNSIGGVVVGSAGSDARLAFILQNEVRMGMLIG